MIHLDLFMQEVNRRERWSCVEIPLDAVSRREISQGEWKLKRWLGCITTDRCLRAGLRTHSFTKHKQGMADFVMPLRFMILTLTNSVDRLW